MFTFCKKYEVLIDASMQILKKALKVRSFRYFECFQNLNILLILARSNSGSLVVILTHDQSWVAPTGLKCPLRGLKMSNINFWFSNELDFNHISKYLRVGNRVTIKCWVWERPWTLPNCNLLFMDLCFQKQTVCVFKSQQNLKSLEAENQLLVICHVPRIVV